MSQPILAVYKGEQFWLLDPVHVMEGQEIRALILSEENRVRHALGDLVVPFSAPAEADVDEEAVAREVEAGLRGCLRCQRLFLKTAVNGHAPVLS
jgi:hypothetical protein